MWWVGESIELLDALAELAGAGAERKEKLASQPLEQRQYSIPIRASYIIECQSLLLSLRLAKKG